MEAAPNKKRSFSVELQSKADLKSVSMTNGTRESVLIEGTIGELVQVGFTEGVILEVVGERGVIRIDLAEHEIDNRETGRKPAEGGD